MVAHDDCAPIFPKYQANIIGIFDVLLVWGESWQPIGVNHLDFSVSPLTLMVHRLHIAGIFRLTSG